VSLDIRLDSATGAPPITHQDPQVYRCRNVTVRVGARPAPSSSSVTSAWLADATSIAATRRPARCPSATSTIWWRRSRR